MKYDHAYNNSDVGVLWVVLCNDLTIHSFLSMTEMILLLTGKKFFNKLK